jgi:hypothetical protein
VHGSEYWKECIKENPGCRYIFLGDYLDPYVSVSGEVLLNNLSEIIELRYMRPADVVLLLGNHDMHYFIDGFPTSTRFNYDISAAAASLFRDNITLFQYAFQDGEYIFTHAGISEGWFHEDFRGDVSRNIADQLNIPMPAQVDSLYRVGYERGGMRGEMGGIFWADIRELSEPLRGFTQVVGHNRVGKVIRYEHNGGRIIFCDCLYNELYLKL